MVHFPHPIRKNIKRVHRLVILPDYQGIGLGRRFLEFIGEKYINDSYDFRITTSNPSLIYYFNKSNRWKLQLQGRTLQHGNNGKMGGMGSKGRIITSWKLI